MPPRLIRRYRSLMKPSWNLTILSICGPNFHSLPVTRDKWLSCTPGTIVILTLAKPCANYVSMSMETLTRAWEVLQDAYQAQMEGDYDRAVELDPEFGNPYNDIGAYLIELGRFDEAIPWLERATEALRYEPRHFPHYNLGRAYLGKEMYSHATRCFQEALEIEPRYSLARQALDSLRRMVN